MDRVFQQFSLFATISVAEIVWLGLDAKRSLVQVRQAIVDKAAAYGLDIEPDRPVHTLSVGEMQRVEIIRALLTNPCPLYTYDAADDLPRVDLAGRPCIKTNQ